MGRGTKGAPEAPSPPAPLEGKGWCLDWGGLLCPATHSHMQDLKRPAVEMEEGCQMGGGGSHTMCHSSSSLVTLLISLGQRAWS